MSGQRRTLWKVKRAGKRIGSWHFTAPGGKRVNTNTADVDAANRFQDRYLARLAKAAQKADTQGAAAATIAALDATPEPTSLASEAPPPPSLPAAEPVASEESTALPVDPDGYIPPPPDTGDWAADAARAASGAPAAEAATPKLDPEWLDGAIEQAASMLVELQIAGQEWSIKRGLKIKPGAIAGDSNLRRPGVELWKQQIRQWMPTDIDAPPWLLALIITGAATLPVQFANAGPLPKEEQKPDDGQAAATSEAVGVAA